MQQPQKSKQIYIGFGLAILATIIWSGNFIVSRAVYQQIPPVSLAFYRWLTASVIIFPLAYQKFKSEKIVVLKNYKYLFWTALTGITLFNTFVYVAGHYTSAINMALIGTTSSPIFAIILAGIFLKEKNSFLRITGLVICISGIVLLLSQGSLQKLLSFNFSTGDLWMLVGALCFAIYNVLVKAKPHNISALSFLFVIFITGTLFLLPFFIVEVFYYSSVQWNAHLIEVIVYLGIGTSVISYLCWNAAIQRLGSSRTALFGNLIPLFSTLEAVLILKEKITTIHVISGLLVITGLVVANSKKANPI